MQKSRDAPLRLIAKTSSCLFDLLFYVEVNSYGNVGTLASDMDVTRIHFLQHNASALSGFRRLTCDETSTVNYFHIGKGTTLSGRCYKRHSVL